MAAFFSIGHSRKKHLKAMAQSLGMKFMAKDEYKMIALLRDFDLFKKGYGKRITNIMHNKDEELNEIRIFDYQYTVGGGSSSRTVRQTVFFAKSKLLALPIYKLQPEHFFHKVGEKLNMLKDIDFEDYPKFSDQYLLQGEHEGLIRNTFTEQVLQYLTDKSGWRIEGINYFLIIYKSGKIVRPPSLNNFFKHSMELTAMFAKKEL